MLSINMKSAVCDCKTPDPYIHKISVKSREMGFSL